MSAKVHGHSVLEMLMEAPCPMTRDMLRQAAQEEFGANARYHTCSASELTLDALVDFLLQRGKVTEADGYLTVHAEELCTHG
jgi:probable metal-binding protein